MAKFVIDSSTNLVSPVAHGSYSFNDNVVQWSDADGLAFYISQLAHLESRIYEAKYTNINYQELVPQNTDVPEWADTLEYVSFDAVTLGKFIGANAQDLPTVTVNANKSIVPLGYAGNAFEYSLDELRKAAAMRMPLDSTYGRIAMRGALEHSQRVAYFGDAERGMTGLFNNPNLALDNSILQWATATGAEIINDMNSLLTKVWVDSANVHIPNVLVLDSDRFSLITSRRMETGTDTTIYEYFMKNNIYKAVTGGDLRIVPRLQMKGAGTGGVDRMMCYELNEENLSMCNPIPWRPLAPMQKDLSVRVVCEYKISGVEFRFPFSGAYRDFPANS